MVLQSMLVSHQKNINSLYEVSYYYGSTCDSLDTYYYFGVNINACIADSENNVLYLIVNQDCETSYYSDNNCTISTPTPSPHHDDDDDDDVDDDADYLCIEINNGDSSVSVSVVDCPDTPTAAPSDGDDDMCFAGSETVLMESGVSKPISDVEVGDSIQVVSADGSLKFSEVVFLPHGANTQKALFAELALASGNSLRATPAHFVLAGACGADTFELTAMQDIAEGSCVQTANGEDEVTGNGLVVDHGIYTVVTKESSGLVVVNDIRASSFAHNHWLVNNYYNIHRTLYEYAPSLMKNRDVVAINLIVGDIALSL
jgi:hypothetical protein